MVEIDENRLIKLVGEILLELLNRGLSRNELLVVAKAMAKGGKNYIGDAYKFKVIKKR